ncbi:MAG: FAD-binding oxidoreductase, partial [Deltaproteobacteria bacterium]
KENVSDSEMVLVSYGFDSSPARPGKADFVVMPRDTISVKQVLEAANRARIPVTTMSGGVNIGGTAVPSQGGIVLDLKWMNKIVEINEDASYAVIEAGVTFDEITAKLIEKGFRCQIPTSPGGSTPMGNFLVRPSGSLANRHLDSFVGLEVVLPDGTIVRTGSSAFPFCGSYLRYGPFPDLTGLFCCAHGTLGVVTRAAIRIYPINESIKVSIVAFDDFSDSINFVKDVSRRNIAEHCIIWNRHIYKGYEIDFSANNELLVPDVLYDDPRAKDSSLPYNLVTVMMSGYKEDMDAHERVLERVSKSHGGRMFSKKDIDTHIARAARSWKSFYIDYHIPGMDQTKKYGLGRYMPWIVTAEPKDIVSIEKEAVEFLDNLKIRPICYYSMPFDYGRAMFFRIFSWLDPQNKDLLANVGTLYQDMYKWAMKKYGATPFRHRRDPNILALTGGYQTLLRSIKKVVDPNNIMNPGVALF